jgi:hypothetical protein
MPHVEIPGYCEVIASARLRGDQEDGFKASPT